MDTETATIPPALELDSLRDQTFLGVRLTQSWGDLRLWEYVLNAHPEIQHIFEIGTWEGGMSRYLAAQATERGIGFTTVDVTRPEKQPPGFVPLDVFAQADEVRDWLRANGPALLFCDGGDKPREMREFAPTLAAGDLLAVHDWNEEASAADVPECLDEVYGALCDALRSHTRFFVRSAR